MSPVHSAYLPSWICFPRVSGDEPVLVKVGGAAKEFSPRERG